MISMRAEYRVSEYRLSSKAPAQFNPQAAEYILRSVVYPPNFPTFGGPGYLRQVSEALRAKLESDAKRAKLDRRMAERQAAIANAENESLRKEIGDLTDDAETDRMYTEDLRRRFKEMSRDNEKLVVEAKSAKSKIEKQAAKIKELEQEVKGRGTKVGKLELELQLKEPLFQTWDNKWKDYILKKYQVDSVTIEKGNRAVHGGNGMADGSLFVLSKLTRQWATKDVDLRPVKPNPAATHRRKPLATEFDVKSSGYGVGDSSEQEPPNIFEELYHYRPTVYATMPTKLLEVIDCEATIKTLKSLNEGLDRPLVEKQQALENISIVVEKYLKLPKEDFDTDPDVIRRVDRVKDLTEMIVIYDRKKSGKASEGRRPS
ncbi:hypothetical protein BKA65DRAFT_547583 [Rhexocercosporidium sp. MPI-PUGE-AT-0058]|nr:hypothetical protein BKA65DRAFT_547583 [Rhexocercosporidium sp. MPI-PUGE-AT-0058]